nr:hypothetical protein WS71_18965 [Burkholderia mayonis]
MSGVAAACVAAGATFVGDFGLEEVDGDGDAGIGIGIGAEAEAEAEAEVEVEVEVEVGVEAEVEAEAEAEAEAEVEVEVEVGFGFGADSGVEVPAVEAASVSAVLSSDAAARTDVCAPVPAPSRSADSVVAVTDDGANAASAVDPVPA